MSYLIYIHGFNSSEKSEKVAILQAEAAAKGKAEYILSPRLAWQPSKAIEQLKVLIEEHIEAGVSLVGSSLGGFYARYLADLYDINAVLINPAVEAPKLLLNHLGEQLNPYTGENYVLTLEHLEELKRIDVTLPNGHLFWLMVQEGDEVLDYQAALDALPHVAKLTHEPAGNHRFENFEQYAAQVLAFCDL
ncbi:YqiA/YcfP family alpha/beta fold hydrolase [Marinomonas epiphytica]